MDNNLTGFYNKRLKQIFFYITYDCNFSCKHCLIGDRANMAFYDKTEVFDTLQTIKSNGGNKVTFLGGEPTLHPDFFEILEYAKKQEFLIVVDTNGSFPSHFWDDKRIENIDTFCFSVDGHVASVHERTRKKGSFDVLLQQISRAQNRQCRVKFTHTVTKSNVDYILDMIDFALDLKINELNIHVATFNGRAKVVLDPEVISPEEWYRAYKNLKEIVAQKTLGSLELRIPTRYCTREELLNVYSNHQCVGKLADRMLILPKADAKNDLGGPLYVCGLLIGEKYKIGWNMGGNLIYNQETDSEYQRYYSNISEIDNIPICPIASKDTSNLNYINNEDLIPLCVSYKPALLSRK